jgi:hypothetical protein
MTPVVLGPQVGQGTFEAGIYSYSVLPLPGAHVFENTTDVTSYSYNPSARAFVSYDTPHIASLKAQYVQTKGLAGSMFWDVRVSILRHERPLNIPEISCQRIRKDLPRLLLRPLVCTAASIRHQYARTPAALSANLNLIFSSIPESYTVKRSRYLSLTPTHD